MHGANVTYVHARVCLLCTDGGDDFYGPRHKNMCGGEARKLGGVLAHAVYATDVRTFIRRNSEKSAYVCAVSPTFLGVVKINGNLRAGGLVICKRRLMAAAAPAEKLCKKSLRISPVVVATCRLFFLHSSVNRRRGHESAEFP